MPFTYLEIEMRKNRIVWLLFLFLAALYFLGVYLLAVAARAAFPFFIFTLPRTAFLFSRKEIFDIIFFAVIMAAFHWAFSAFGMSKKILDALGAQPPDPEDSYHQAFKNIVEEVSIATGRSTIECVCLPSVALNSFLYRIFAAARLSE